MNNNERPLLLLDSDGVLTEWFSRIDDFHKHMGLCNKHLQNGFLEGNSFITIDKLFPASSIEASKTLCSQYNESPFIADLDVMEPGSPAVLGRLSKVFDMVVITCIGDTDRHWIHRKRNLTKHYGNIFSEIICLPIGADKYPVISSISKHRNVVLWLDDGVNHVKQGIKAGVPSFQFSYDMGPERRTGEVPDLCGWKAVEEYLTK